MTFEETAHAKLNLALHVRRRRPDGYHDLETIFAFTELGDRLTAEPAEELSLEIDGPFAEGLSAGEDNLVVRAALALQSSQKAPFVLSPSTSLRRALSKDMVAQRSEHAAWFDKLTTNGGGKGFGAKLKLTKNLPVASGIGGGSADAAAALRLLNRLWGLDRSLEELAAIGASLGADVPACVHSRALRGEGRGDALTPVETGFKGAPVLLVNPRVGVSTAAVFAAWDGVDRGALGDAADGRNDLEAPARQVAPVVGEVLRMLAGQPGARMVRMSGSGATCFALFGNRDDRDGAGRVSRASGWWVAETTLRPR